jgi:hypothetical protein
MSNPCNCNGSTGENSQTIAARLERPRYSPGLILEDSDLTSAVTYTQELSRLLFRNLFGCGVICGLGVRVEEKCGLTITIAPGLALDGCGDPVQLVKPVAINFGEHSDGFKRAKDGFWVSLCGKEKFCAPRALVCDADEFDAITQPTRVRSMAEVSISFKEPECVCQWDASEANAGNTDWQIDPHECHADCGFGTACDCGCCVLLAYISYLADAGEFSTRRWIAHHKDVRRVIRPMLGPDVEPYGQPDPPSDAPATASPETSAQNTGPAEPEGNANSASVEASLLEDNEELRRENALLKESGNVIVTKMQDRNISSEVNEDGAATEARTSATLDEMRRKEIQDNKTTNKR